MGTDDYQQVQLKVPKTWLPELEVAAKAVDRSRHNLMLHVIRQFLDAQPLDPSGRVVEVKPGHAVVNGSKVATQPPNVVQHGSKDVTPRLKKAPS